MNNHMKYKVLIVMEPYWHGKNAGQSLNQQKLNSKSKPEKMLSLSMIEHVHNPRLIKSKNMSKGVT